MMMLNLGALPGSQWLWAVVGAEWVLGSGGGQKHGIIIGCHV